MKQFEFYVIDSFTRASGVRCLPGRSRVDAVRRASSELLSWLSPFASRCLVYDCKDTLFAVVDRAAGVSFPGAWHYEYKAVENSLGWSGGVSGPWCRSYAGAVSAAAGRGLRPAFLVVRRRRVFGL